MRTPEMDEMKAAAARFQAGVAERGQRGTRGLNDDDVTQDRGRTPEQIQSVIDAIMQNAKARGTAGSQADTLRSLSDERIIGRGDLQNLNYLEVGIAVARGVARIRLAGGSGTGSMVGPRIMLTNNHVLGGPKDAVSATAQFDVQDDADGQQLMRQDYKLDPGFFFLTFPDLDATLVGVAERSARDLPLDAYPWTQLQNADGELEDEDAITIIQHPLGGMKQIAFRNNRLIQVPRESPFVHYTTDTQPGSSGSPCFDDLWRLVALHHSGVAELDKDGNILTRDKKPFRKGHDRPDTINWIANEGARISAIVDALQRADLKDEWKRVRDDMLARTPPNAVALARLAAVTIPREAPAPAPAPTPNEWTNDMPGTGKGVSITVNISNDEIHSVLVKRGAGGQVITTASRIEPPTEQAEPETPSATDGATDGDETTAIDGNWKNRRGYDPNFLGVPVPLPKLTADQRKQSARVPSLYLADGDDDTVFKYHHYSLAFNVKRRIAWYSAANVDGTQMGHKYDRGKDKWSYDPRLDDKKNPINQMGEELYSARNTDRGHITRYLDVQWGANVDEARNATNDTFHFSNCALQLDEFNEGKERWQGIERYLLEQKARKDQRKLTIISGPVLKRTDPIYKNAKMKYRIRIPLSFWKVCVLVPEDKSRKLSVTAFQLGQHDITDLPDFEETFDVVATQITVAKLEKLTSLDFGDLKKFDHFEKKKDGSLETVDSVPFTTPDEIVF